MTKLELMNCLFQSPLRQEIGSLEFTVLGYHCSRADDKTGESWASASSIAADVGFLPRNVQRGREALVKRGYLRDTGRRKPTFINGKKVYTAVYAVVFQKLREHNTAHCAIRRKAPCGAFDADGTAQNEDATAQGDTMVRRSAPAKSVIESINESNRESLTPSASCFDLFWKAWPENEFKTIADRDECRRIWDQMVCDAIGPSIVEHVEASKRSAKWMNENGRYAGKPQKYLQKEQWTAQPPAKKPLERAERIRALVLADIETPTSSPLPETTAPTPTPRPIDPPMPKAQPFAPPPGDELTPLKVAVSRAAGRLKHEAEKRNPVFRSRDHLQDPEKLRAMYEIGLELKLIEGAA